MSELRLNTVTDKDTDKSVNVDALHYQNTQLVRNLGPWQPGLVFENKTDYATHNDQAIVASDETTLPYTTQGNDPTNSPDAGNVVPFAEVTRSDVVLNVASISDLQALPTSGLVDGQQVDVKEYHEGTGIGGGSFYWHPSSTESDNGGTIFEAGGVTSGRWKRKESRALTPEYFGARGDGTTLDREAFERLSNYANTLSSVRIEMRPSAVYLIGEQEFTGNTDDRRSYRALKNILIENIGSVVIEGNGAILKFQGGLRFGTFDPVTGDRHDPSMPFTDYNYRADVGDGVSILGCDSVEISNLEIDGNIENQVVGGLWGDKGRQCTSHGLYIRNNSSTRVSNVYSHHNCLDGIMLSFSSLSTDNNSPASFVNVRSEYNARQGLSWVGGNGLTLTNCKFNYSGHSTLPIASSPRSGLDIEASGGRHCRNLTAINCEFLYNGSNGMVADTGDSADCHFIDCTFMTPSDRGNALWADKPRFKFTKCKIHGLVSVTYRAQNKGDGTVFEDCLFSDESKYGGPFHYGTFGLTMIDNRPNTQFRNCSFIAETTRLGLFRKSATFDDCYFEIRTEFSGRVDALHVEQCTLSNCTIKEDLAGVLPDHAHYVKLDNTKILNKTTIDSVNNKLFWNSWSPGAGGFNGLSVTTPIEGSSVKINKRLQDEDGSRDGFATQYANNAMPSAGDSFVRGDFVWNESPSIAGEAGSQYVVLGWSRLTTSSNHDSGTDWAECRVLTGT